MHRKVIKNVRGQTLGFIDTDRFGREIGKDVHGKMVGRYNPATDQTYNVKGQLQTHGDTLSWLIGESDD
ncbi:MAG TPA: hypothetical protein VFA95_11565 [Gammaproteobacteria bacterium]|nr:hypothetical protein [Gammaproteobacteria bacterium]